MPFSPVSTPPTRKITMRTRLARVLVIAAALSATASVPLSAAEKTSPLAFKVSTVTVAAAGYDRIAPGATRSEVLHRMGEPFRELSYDVWVYTGYRADLNAADALDCNILVITFAHDAIASLELVNQQANRIIAAGAKVDRSERYATNQ